MNAGTGTISRRSTARGAGRLAAGTAAGLLMMCASVRAEVLVRWSLDDIPPPTALGIHTIAVPAASAGGVRAAIAQGYRVYVEVDAAAAAAFRPPPGGLAGVLVAGDIPADRLASLERRLQPSGARVLRTGEHPRARWPHIRTNWVTRDNEVLQVASRSAQPWIENNAAVFGLMRGTAAPRPALLSYAWTPVTIAAMDRAPRLEHYLLAIAEAGSFGGGLLLPLHEEFQRDLLLGRPEARGDWEQIRQHLVFHGWDLPSRYEPVANIAVVTGAPLVHFDTLNLLLRHNLPFRVVPPEAAGAAALEGFDLMILADSPPDVAALAMRFAREGGTVISLAAASEPNGSPWRQEPGVESRDDRRVYRIGAGQIVEMLQPVTDPDRFAFDVRQALGRERRVLDIWNGITVLARPYRDPARGTLLVTAVNYAAQPLPVQLRVKGLYRLVRLETPDQPLTLLPFTHRDGFTECVIPSLTLGARLFLE